MPELMRTLGRYDIVREIGRGGMAVVYLARQTDLDRVVALKELAAFHATDPALAERFVRESRIAGSLSHPNIVTVHDFLEHDGTPYIAMEFVEGGSLRPLVGHLTLAQIAGVLECILAALAHAEGRGIVHRDLKPENVMVTADGSVKIADFGIAKALNQVATAHLSATGTAMGTPAYMAPEQALATGIGPWTDLYSTGVIAYELLVGRLPFDDRDTPMAVLLRHIQDPIPPPRSVNPELDERLEGWLERMLEKAPERRPAGAHEAWEELEEIVLAILGPRWRREARLVERPSGNGRAARTPTTPAPVQQPSPGDTPTKLDETPTPPPPARRAPPTVAAPPKQPLALRRSRRTLILGSLIGVAATSGVVLAFLVDSGANQAAPPAGTSTSAANPPPASPPPASPPPPPPAPAPPVVEDVAISKQGSTVKATVETSGAKLAGGTITVNDRDITDGEASFVLWRSNLATRIGRRSAEGLTVAVRGGKPARLAFTLSAAPGTFSAMSDPQIVAGTTVQVSLTEAPATSPPPPPPAPSPQPPPPPPSTPDIG